MEAQEKATENLHDDFTQKISETYENLMTIQGYVSKNWSQVSSYFPQTREYEEVVLTTKIYEIMDTIANNPYLDKPFLGWRARNKREYLFDCIQNLGGKLEELRTVSETLATQVRNGFFQNEEANMLETLVRGAKHFQHQPCMPPIKNSFF